MKYFLLTFATIYSAQTFAQTKNQILLDGSLIPINYRYNFNGYSKDVSALRSSNLTYLRGINAINTWLVGVGIGYKAISINEINPVNGSDENTIATFFTPRFIIRKEEFLGKRNRGFVESGINLNIGVNSKTVDYAGNNVAGNALINSTAFFFSFGYQYKLNESWKLDFGIIGSGNLSPGMLLNGRKIRFREDAFTSGISYYF